MWQASSPTFAIATMISPSSLFRLVSFPGIGWSRSSDRRADRIRAAMLALLESHGGHSIQRLMQRVRFTNDLETLWYLRQDLLSVLSEIEGEVAAQRKMKQINGLFKGGLPPTMGPRVHPRSPA